MKWAHHYRFNKLVFILKLRTLSLISAIVKQGEKKAYRQQKKFGQRDDGKVPFHTATPQLSLVICCCCCCCSSSHRYKCGKHIPHSTTRREKSLFSDSSRKTRSSDSKWARKASELSVCVAYMGGAEFSGDGSFFSFLTRRLLCFIFFFSCSTALLLPSLLLFSFPPHAIVSRWAALAHSLTLGSLWCV